MKCQRRTDVTYGNPIIARVEQSKADEKHYWAIRNMKTSIDNRAPKAMPHLTSFGRDYFAKKKATTEAAFADLKMIQSIAKTMTRPFELPSHRGPTSLNADWRKKELFRITMDNHKLLERLENLKPYYDTQKMEADHAEHHRHMINASYSARKEGLYDDQLARPRFPRAIQSRSLPALEEVPALPDNMALPPAPAPAPKKNLMKKPKPKAGSPGPMDGDFEALEDGQAYLQQPDQIQQPAFLTEHPRQEQQDQQQQQEQEPPPGPPAPKQEETGGPDQNSPVLAGLSSSSAPTSTAPAEVSREPFQETPAPAPGPAPAASPAPVPAAEENTQEEEEMEYEDDTEGMESMADSPVASMPPPVAQDLEEVPGEAEHQEDTYDDEEFPAEEEAEEEEEEE